MLFTGRGNGFKFNLCGTKTNGDRKELCRSVQRGASAWCMRLKSSYKAVPFALFVLEQKRADGEVVHKLGDKFEYPTVPLFWEQTFYTAEQAHKFYCRFIKFIAEVEFNAVFQVNSYFWGEKRRKDALFLHLNEDEEEYFWFEDCSGRGSLCFRKVNQETDSSFFVKNKVCGVMLFLKERKLFFMDLLLTQGIIFAKQLYKKVKENI